MSGWGRWVDLRRLPRSQDHPPRRPEVHPSRGAGVQGQAVASGGGSERIRGTKWSLGRTQGLAGLSFKAHSQDVLV